jgi:SAM-dependent methyltransferase
VSAPGRSSVATAHEWAYGELEAVDRCPLCASAERTTLHEGLEDRFFGTSGRWTLRRCLGCESAYLDPRPTAAAIVRAYDAYYTHGEPQDPPPLKIPLGRLRRALRNGYLNSILGYRLEPAAPLARLVAAPFPGLRRQARRTVRDLPYPTTGGRVLDVGCGNGSFLVTMAGAGWDVEGVDPDARAVASGRSHGLQLHEGTIESFASPPSRFDAITMNHVFEHLPSPRETLARCRFLLHPRGVLWIATPNVAAKGHRAYGVDWVGLDAPRHLVLPTAGGLREALESAGFEVEFLQPPTVGWMLRTSECLRADRLGVRVGALRWTRLAVEAKARDLRLLRDPAAGEELVVRARPLPAGD